MRGISPKKGVLILALVLGLPLSTYYVTHDWEGRPVCHRQIDGAFMQWMVDSGMAVNEGNNSFPNIGGVGSNSLAVISPYLKDMDWAKVYRYVPGLRQNDPDGLVMMYMDRPTRWIWHGQTPTIFRAKAWLVVPVDFREGMGSNSIAPGELSSCVSTVEFKRRLKATLDFIHTNQRPNWQAIVAEHSKFLEGIEGLAK